MTKTNHPNILWVCTDQQRFDTISALGNQHISTPNLDRLCAQGTAFTRAYCQAPICTPSRSSFLSGMYPSTIGASRNGNAYFADRFPLLPKILADEGYRCGNVGKLHLASASQGVEPRVDDGYSEFYYSHAPRDDWEDGHDYADWVTEKGENLGELSMNIDGIPAEFHQSAWMADRSIEFMSRNDARPWFLSVNVYDPHPPFNPPKQYRDMFPPQSVPAPHFQPGDLEQQKYLEDIDFQSKAQSPELLDIPNPVLPVDPAPDPDNPGGETAGERDAQTLISAYYAMIRLIDDQLGRILDALEESGQAGNTIVVFTSDHGETLGDHGLILKGCRFYEGLVRVPMIWSWPGHIKANAVRDDLVELTDIAPTLMALAGLDPLERMQGFSLQPTLEHGAVVARSGVRSEFYDALDLPHHNRATMWRTDRYKLVVYHGTGKGELFDLDADPWEHDNLWLDPAHAGIKHALLAESYDHTVASIDPGPPRSGSY